MLLHKILWSADNVTNIEDYAFKDCTNLNNIDIPNSVVSIGREAFCNCTAISSISIPAAVTEIVYGTFAGCTSLSSIELPNNLTQIADYSFMGCESLTTVEVPSKVDTIGQNTNVSSYPSGYTFWGCTSLTSILIPESTVNIAEYTFGYRFDNLTIYGTLGSYAETYANENNINFNAIKYVSPYGNNFGVEVLAPTSIPANTTLNVNKILEDETSETYDISLTCDGKQVDLKDQNAVVRIPIPKIENKLDYKVYRKELNENCTNMQATVSNGHLVFITDHFSEYVITTKKLITDTILGDVNGDERVNDQDSILLSRYLSEWDNEIEISAADLNGDGKVNDQDSIMLARTLAGWYD